MSTPEFSYPINPPTPEQPTSNPSPPSPSAGSPTNDTPAGDVCELLQQANENITPECDNVHFGTPKCEVDWVYFNTAPCGFGPKPYQNGIGFAGSYFQAWDQKGFFRIEGLTDSDAQEPNLYSYVGEARIFEVYMYQNGLNIKGKQGGQLGSREDCHINIYKDGNQTEIDYQGNTINGEYGAQIFKSDIFKQTAELFVQKYDYNQEWVGIESNVSKAFVWGGLNQSNFFRLMHDNTSPPRGFLEILRDGYTTYAQLQVKDDKVNLYGQLGSTDYYFGIEATQQKIEEILYFANTIVKLKADNSEASTYNTFRPAEYATLVSKNGEDYVYLKGNGDGYSFLESKFGEARLWGSADGGNDYFDIKTQGAVSLQMKQGEDYIYVAPEDIPENSSNENDHYASFNKFWWITEDKQVKVAAIISSKEIDLRHLGTCWAKYPCLPVDIGPPCIADLTFGGPSNDKCKLTAFDVYCGTEPEFELYQYNLGLDLKPTNNNDVRAAFYTDGGATFALDVNGTQNAYINAKNSQGLLQAYAHFNNDYNGFVYMNNTKQGYLTADGSYRYLILEDGGNPIWRTVAGANTADTTIQYNETQVYLGLNSTQAAIGYRFDGQKLAFGYASNDIIDFRLRYTSASKAFLFSKDDEAKIQVDKGDRYGYMFSDSDESTMTLYGSIGYVEGKAKGDEGKMQVSYEGTYSYILATIEEASNYNYKNNSYAYSIAEASEGKHQVSKDGTYGYITATNSNADLELFKGSSYAKGEATNNEGKFQVSQGSAYGYMKCTSSSVSVYLNKGSDTVNIDTADCNGKTLYIREIDVCSGGEAKKMRILASDPY